MEELYKSVAHERPKAVLLGGPDYEVLVTDGLITTTKQYCILYSAV